MIPEFEVIIPACGKGKRFEASILKQFAAIENVPILIRTLRQFAGIKELYGAIVVCDQEYKTYVESLLRKYSISYVKKVVIGGERRQDTVYNALRYLTLKKIVVIHDAVRPCVTKDVIIKGVEYAEEFGASCAALPATQTIGKVKDGFIVENLDRNLCWILQTPQVFKYGVLINSYEKAHKEHFIATDDTQVVLHYSGQKIKIYKSNEENIKITYKRDLDAIAAYFKKTD